MCILWCLDKYFSGVWNLPTRIVLGFICIFTTSDSCFIKLAPHAWCAYIYNYNSLFMDCFLNHYGITFKKILFWPVLLWSCFIRYTGVRDTCPIGTFYLIPFLFFHLWGIISYGKMCFLKATERCAPNFQLYLVYIFWFEELRPLTLAVITDG